MEIQFERKHQDERSFYIGFTGILVYLSIQKATFSCNTKENIILGRIVCF